MVFCSGSGAFSQVGQILITQVDMSSSGFSNLSL